MIARAATSPELALFRSAGQRTSLHLAIKPMASVYTARVNQTITTTDQVNQITYDGGSGTLANVLVDMTLLVGSAAGLGDKGVLRIRNAPAATVLYFGETSDVAWADNDYLTVLNDFQLFDRPASSAGGTLRLETDVDYAYQNTLCDPVPIMGPALGVVALTGATVSLTISPGASYCPGSTISSYYWSASGPASVTVTNHTTTSPTFTFSAAGWYRLALSVDAANGISRTGYRWVRVWSAADPLTECKIGSVVGSRDAGGWEFNITLLNATDAAAVYDGALVALVADDWYGTTHQSIGPIAGYENVVAVGWIAGETIDWNPRAGAVSFKVSGPQYWLGQIGSQALSLKDAVTPAAWDEMHDLTIDQALWHVAAWRSTITTVIDITLTGDTTLAKAIQAQGSLWETLTTIGKKIGAPPLCDRYGRLFCEIDYQLLASADRAALPVVMDVTKTDWKDEISLTRKTQKPVSSLDLNAQLWDGVTATQICARAPGGRAGQFGRSENADAYIVIDQTRANELAGLLLAQRNNPYPNVPLSLAQTNRLIDICPRQVLTQSIASGDTLRGIVWSTRKLLPRRVELVLGKSGKMHTEVEAEAETTGAAGITVYPPQPPMINTPPVTPPPGGGFITPPPNTWFPPIISLPPTNLDCVGDLGLENGPYGLYWDRNDIMAGETAYCYFPCGIRPATDIHLPYVNKSFIRLTALWGDDAYSNFLLTAIDSSKADLISPISVVGDTLTFGPTDPTPVAGFKLALAAGGGFTIGSQISTGTVLATNYDGVTLGVTPGKTYALEIVGGSWSNGSSYTSSLWHISNAPNPNLFGYQAWPGGINPPWASSVVWVVTDQLSRVYWTAATSIVSLSVNGNIYNPAEWAHYTGSLTYCLSQAVSYRRIQIQQSQIKNICQVL